MSALMYVVNEVKSYIPHEILYYALMLDEVPETANLTSLDDKLIHKVIRKRVWLDTNIVGGMEMVVPLNLTQPLFYENFYTVYRVDKSLTLNREIVSALGLSSMPVNAGFGNPITGGPGGFSTPFQSSSVCGQGYNPVMSVANRIGDSAAISGLIHNAHLELVGPNTVLVNQHYRMLANLGLRCIVENESNFNNIQPRSWKALGQLCLLATKAYIWTKLIVNMNSGVLAGGQELGMFRSIVEGYESAEEDYRTYLEEVWAPVSFMNDNSRYARYLSSMLAPDL